MEDRSDARSSHRPVVSEPSRSCSKPGRRLSGNAREARPLLDPTGHYDGLRSWLTTLVEPGYVSREAPDRLVVVDTAEAALDVCSGVRDRPRV